MNKYWIPGPITNYGTTEAGFHGEVRVVLASDHEARLDELQQVIDDRDKALGFEILSPETQAAFRASVQEIDGINLWRVKELEARLAEADERHSRFNKAVGELSTQVVQLQDRLAALQSAAWDVCDVMQDALDTPEDADTKAIQAALDAMGELIPAQRPADRETGAT